MLSIHKNYKADHPEGEHGHPHPHMPHVGMRKVKSILALLAAFLIWQPFRLLYPDLEVHPIFIYIYALLEIRDNSAKTVNFGKVRIKATILALALGLPALALRDELLALAGGAVWEPFVEIAVLLLGVLLTLIASEKLGYQEFCGFAAVVFIILMISDANRYVYATLRALQTILGVFVAWVINVRLFPYPGKPAAPTDLGKN